MNHGHTSTSLFHRYFTWNHKSYGTGFYDHDSFFFLDISREDDPNETNTRERWVEPKQLRLLHEGRHVSRYLSVKGIAEQQCGQDKIRLPIEIDSRSLHPHLFNAFFFCLWWSTYRHSRQNHTFHLQIKFECAIPLSRPFSKYLKEIQFMICSIIIITPMTIPDTVCPVSRDCIAHRSTSLLAFVVPIDSTPALQPGT